jgi:hypothetical protein
MNFLRALTVTASSVLAASFSCGTTHADTIYMYTGNRYTFTQDSNPPAGTYDNTMNITGSFTVDNPLPGDLNLADITAPVQHFSFFDGRNTITDKNFDFLLDFSVSTDASGALTAWNIDVGKGNFDPQQFEIVISSTKNDAGVTKECVTFVGVCRGFLPDSGEVNHGDNGVWTSSSSTPSAVPLPAAGAGLPGLVFGSVGLLAWWRRKRKAVSFAAA